MQINQGRMFGTTDLLQKALDATVKRSEVITQNIANVDTPGYQRKDVAFDAYLATYLEKNGKTDTRRSIEPKVYVDRTVNPYRLDGNTVDIDVEMAYLAENQIKGDALVSQINYNFRRLNSVLR